MFNLGDELAICSFVRNINLIKGVIMKILRGLVGLGEIILLVITVVNLWGTNFQWLATTWLVYLIITLCLAFYETGKEMGNK